MDVPLDVPSDIRESRFYGYLTSAYEYEVEYFASWLLRIAKEFKTALEQSDLKEQPGVPELLAALRLTIDFLESIPDERESRGKPLPEAAGLKELLESIPGEQVSLYSYDRAPSINDLLAAFSKGSGGDDWAIEELVKKGGKGRSALLSVLKKEKNKERLLAAVSMLLIVFRDDQTVAAIQRFLDACDEEIGKEAAILVAAYTSAHSEIASRQRRGRSDLDTTERQIKGTDPGTGRIL